MIRFRDRTIRGKLMAVIMLISTAALLLASLSFVLVSWFVKQTMLQQDLASLADAIGGNCEVALMFELPDDAEHILATVEAKPSVVQACLYDAKGSLFAAFDPSGDAAALLPQTTGTNHKTRGEIRVARPVTFNGEHIGTVFLQADTREIRSAMLVEAGILGFVTLLSLGAAYLIAARFQNLISEPIIKLTNTAREITEEKGSTLRAPRQGADELETLTEAFSDMLIAIEEAHRALVTSERRYQTLFRTAEVSLWEEDISRLILSLQKLRDAGVEDMRQYLEAHQQLVWDMAQQVKVIDVNPATVRMFDAESKKQVLSSLATLIDPESFDAILEEIIAIAEGQPFFKGEVVYRTLTGRKINALLSASLPTKARESSHIIVSIMDITDQKLVEQELEEHRNHLEQLVKKRTAQLQSRVSEVEALNETMVDLTDNLRASNAELEQTSTELTAVNRELEAFAYSVSHDLRAPLRHILGFVAMLERHTAGSLNEQACHDLDVIKGSATRMSQLIDDLLSFSRTGRAEMKKSRFSLTELALSVVAEVQDQQRTSREIQWQVHELPEVDADRAMIRQVLLNLVGNAVKYTKPREHTEIEVGAAQTDDTDKHVVYVRDNGVGFDPRYSHKLFGVFQRLHRAEEFEGTGIGLATVRRIVQRHGGSTWAESAIGEGACFYFSLPRVYLK